MGGMGLVWFGLVWGKRNGEETRTEVGRHFGRGE